MLFSVNIQNISQRITSDIDWTEHKLCILIVSKLYKKNVYIKSRFIYEHIIDAFMIGFLVVFMQRKK